MELACLETAERHLDRRRASRADTFVKMFDDPLPHGGEQSIYLTPTFSDSGYQHYQSWHHQCREMLREMNYTGIILIPESRSAHGGARKGQNLRWCAEALETATHLVFNFKNQTESESRQLMYQLGYALGLKKCQEQKHILLVSQRNFTLGPLTHVHLLQSGILVHQSLNSLLRALLH